MVDIGQLIAALNPAIYCDAAVRRQVKKSLKEGRARHDEQMLSTAAEEARLVEPNAVSLEDLEAENPFRLPGFKSPVERHTLVYDAFDESLEAFYFWLLDQLRAEEWTVSKLTDTFRATPGSGLFSDLVRRQTQAQHEATRLLREAHSLIQDILRTAADQNKQFTSVESSGPTPGGRAEAQASLWQAKFERLKLYARWLGPYLRQARQLEQNAHGEAGLVSVFNTASVKVTLLAEREYPVEEDVDQGQLPRLFLKARRRAYCSVLVLGLKLRAAPERNSRGAYGYRGRFELTLTSYALSREEIAVLRQELDRENLGEVMATVGEKASQTLNQILKQMERFVAPPARAEPKPDDPNPFLALFGWEDRPAGPARPAANGGAPQSWWSIKPDTDVESVVRSQAILDARQRCLELYNRCKAMLGMASA